MLPMVLLALPASAWAGMPSFGLEDIYRMRLEELSFFLVLVLVCALVFKLLWAVAFQGMAAIPRLTYRQSLGLTMIFGFLMLLILTMISGVREVLTPGAWNRQGATYRLTDPAQEPIRRRSLEQLRTALFDYAKAHDGKFPSHDFVPEIPDKLWESPDQDRSHYIFLGGRTLSDANALLVVEPRLFGDSRFGLFTSGEIKALTHLEVEQSIRARRP